MYKRTLRNPAGSVSELLLRGMAPVFAGIVAVNVIVAADPTAAQQPPPIHGVTGTIATEGTIQETTDAGHTILVKLADGITRLFHLNKESTIHSGDAAGEEALRALKKGTAVVVHYTTEGENLTAEEIDRLGEGGLKQMEGVVTALNRGDRTITLKLADGTQQTLRLRRSGRRRDRRSHRPCGRQHRQRHRLLQGRSGPARRPLLQARIVRFKRRFAIDL